MSGPPTHDWRGDPPPPPEVPDFDLLRPIGSGSFGQVWLAANRTTGQLRAVKLIALHPSDRVDRAGREIVSITRLETNVRTRHPNLLSILHVGKTAEQLFYVMDPADDITGSQASSDASYRPATLRARLQDGALPLDDCLRFSRQLLAGLACLHQAGMVHRDVKPANCLFVGGELKLADFGLLTEDTAHVSRVGTLKYMPPDGHMDVQADVYAAGLVIYEMLTGLPPESFPHLGARAREVAETPALCGLNRMVLHACQPDPKQRFADAEEMLGQWGLFGMGKPRHRAYVRRLLLLAIGCIVAVVVLGALRFWPSQPQAVEVSFITEPFGATIWLDGKVLMQTDGTPFLTPCTVPDLPTQSHRVSFKREGTPELDVGRIDFSRSREVTARWGTASASR